MFTILLVLTFVSPALGGNHTARAKLKADSRVAGKGLSQKKLDDMIDELKEREAVKQQREAEFQAKLAMQEMLAADPALRDELLAE